MRRPLFSLTKKDFRIDYFRAGGKGGQKQNKTSSGCRVTHRETGIAAEARDTRSQSQNKEAAFMRLYNNPKFQFWFKRKQLEEINKADGLDAVKYAVEKMLNDENVKVEVFNAETGKWEVESRD